MADIALTMDTTTDAASGTGAGTAQLDRLTVLRHRRSPGHDLADEMIRGSGQAVRLREIPFLSQVALRGSADWPSGGVLAEAVGASLPARVGQVAGSADGSDTAVLWLSPDEFLVVEPDEAVTGISPESRAAALGAVLDGLPGQAVDVSANRTTLELAGPRALSVLQKSCQIDLHPRAFTVGTAVVTLLESTGVIIWRTGAETWRIMPRSSFTTHVVRWLLDGMREYR